MTFINWFISLECEMNDIPPCNNYNFEETGFQFGECKADIVITAYPSRFQ